MGQLKFYGVEMVLRLFRVLRWMKHLPEVNKIDESETTPRVELEWCYIRKIYPLSTTSVMYLTPIEEQLPYSQGQYSVTVHYYTFPLASLKSFPELVHT